MEQEGKLLRIKASKGIVFAAGGFFHNQAMMDKYQKKPASAAWTAASASNTGEVIEIGIKAGAKVDLMDDSWGMPTTIVPGEHPVPLVLERSYPGSMMVNCKGQRFTNESTSYVDVAHAMYKENSALFIV